MTGKKLAMPWGFNPTIMPPPDKFNAEGLLEVLPEDLHGKRILFPRAESARELLPEELRRRGAVVDVVVVYRTVKSAGGLTDLRATLEKEKIDCVAFTSRSAIRFFAETLDGDFLRLLAGIPIAVIGPIAGKGAEEFGLKPVIQPEKATIEDLVDAIAKFW
jgi:uroporphyrinogen III methyltransferase/synthase